MVVFNNNSLCKIGIMSYIVNKITHCKFMALLRGSYLVGFKNKSLS